MTNDEIAGFFNATRSFLQENPDLGDLQAEVWFHTCQHFEQFRARPAVLRKLSGKE